MSHKIRDFGGALVFGGNSFLRNFPELSLFRTGTGIFRKANPKVYVHFTLLHN